MPIPGVPTVPRAGAAHAPGPLNWPGCAVGAAARGGGQQPPFAQISACGKKNKALYFVVIKTKRCEGPAGAVSAPGASGSGICAWRERGLMSPRCWKAALAGDPGTHSSAINSLVPSPCGLAG